MFNNHHWKLIGLACLAGMTCLSYGDTQPLDREARTVRVGVFQAAPLVLVKEDTPEGLFIDLIKYFSWTLNRRIQYVVGTWSELLASLEKGEIDLLPAVGYTSERVAIYDFSKNPVYIDSGVLFTSPKFTLHTIFDLQGKRVAGVKGSTFTIGFVEYVASFGVRCEIILTNDNREVMEAIATGAADAGVCIYSLGNELAREFPVAITPISFSPIALEFAVPKGRNADVLAGIDRLMAPMISDPDSLYSRSFSKWTTPPASNELPAWFWWGIVGLLAAGLLLGSWTFFLKRQVVLKTRHLLVEIADRKRAEAALRESEHKLTTLFALLPVGVSVLDSDHKIAYMNPALEKILGISLEDLRRGDYRKRTYLRSDGGEMMVDEFASSLAIREQRVIHNVETGVVKEDRQVIWMNVSAAPVMFSDWRVIIVTTDITDRKRTEEQIREHNRLLEEAVQQKQREMEALFERLLRQEKLATIGQMAGNIAHELRNPLGAVKQSVYYLKRLAQTQALTASNPNVLRHLDLMDAELNTSERVIADLLEMTRMKPLQRQPTDLRGVLTEAIARCRLPEQVCVPIALEPDPFTIYADPLQFRQVLLNVLTNAAQAIEGAGEITISAKQLTESEESVMTIHDTGMGVAPEAIPKVFEPLYTTKATGTGLGLSLCKQIIENHQGRISLTSQPGQGTTVTIALPRV